MANSLGLKSNPVAGLGTFQYTVLVAGPYTIECKSTIPVAANSPSGQQSNLTINIKQNSTSLVSVGGASTNPTPTQASIGTSAQALFAVNDVIQVVLSSSNAVDSIPNAVKSVINVFQGPQ